MAVNVQILSVSLSNDKSIDSTFSARVGTDVYFYSDNGKAEIYLGEYNPRVDSVQLEREGLMVQDASVPGGDGGAGSWQDALIPMASPFMSRPLIQMPSQITSRFLIRKVVLL